MKKTRKSILINSENLKFGFTLFENKKEVCKTENQLKLKQY